VRSIGDCTRRIGWSLNPTETLEAGTKGRLNGLKVGGIHDLDIETPGDREFRQPLAHTPIEFPRHQHMVARKERLKYCCCCRHSGGKQDAAQPAPSSAANKCSA